MSLLAASDWSLPMLSLAKYGPCWDVIPCRWGRTSAKTSASCLSSSLNFCSILLFKYGSLSSFNFQSTLSESCPRVWYLIYTRAQGGWDWVSLIPLPNPEQGLCVVQLGPGVCIWLNQPKMAKRCLERGHLCYHVDLAIGAILGEEGRFKPTANGVSYRGQITIFAYICIVLQEHVIFMTSFGFGTSLWDKQIRY